MKIQYFILAKTLFTRNHQLLLTPELQETYREGVDDELINRICHKVNYYSFEDEMTLKDISLIEDLKNEECYLFFIATDKPAQALEHVNLPWGEGLPEALTDLVFLGWNIGSYSDFAVYYGCYPIQLLEYEDGREVQTFKIHDPDAINQWGLLKDQASCDKYMEINTNEVEMVVNGIHYKMEWEARAVYCDHYTYAKLIKAYNDLV